VYNLCPKKLAYPISVQVFVKTVHV